MSTRAGIIIKDGYNEVHFYRHSDGYPEVTLPKLEKFLKWVKDGKIRNNVQQASGWLIIIGAEEYNVYNGYKCPKCEKTTLNGLQIYYEENRAGSFCKNCSAKAEYVSEPLPAENALSPEKGQHDFANWKVGAFEPTRNVRKHGDLEFIYTVDLKKLEITYKNI